MEKVKLEKVLTLEYNLNEAYKTLRTNLQFCGDSIKTIMLTSCTPNEGKSTVAFNLSYSMAMDGKRVLLVDADLRKSVFVGRHGATTDKEIKGLSHYLSGQVKQDEIIYETNLENLHMIFAGPTTPNPTELLGNHYFEELNAEVRDQYDYVIIDAPPLGSVIDSAIITKVCDGTILVVENNNISYKFAQNVMKQLEKTECKILGAVLNKVDLQRGGYYNGYYKGYYKGYYNKYYEEYQ